MPLQTGDKISLTIEDIAFGGEGVGRLDDFVVFVPFVVVGEAVEVEITEVKKNFARAKLLRVEKASPARVEPPCVYFGKCGGCQYQHMAYDEQLKIKQKQIADLFESRKNSTRSCWAGNPLPFTLRIPEPHHGAKPVEQAGTEIKHRLCALGLWIGGGH